MTHPTPDTLHAALSLPYSVGAQRLLREILSTVTGTPLPETDPRVRHGPVQLPRLPPAPRRLPRAADRREVLLQALRAGLVTQQSAAHWQWPWSVVLSDVGNMRTKGYSIPNVGTSHKAAYILRDAPDC